MRRGLCDWRAGTLIRDTRDLGGILVNALMGFLKTHFSVSKRGWIGLWVQQEELGATQCWTPGGKQGRGDGRHTGRPSDTEPRGPAPS